MSMISTSTTSSTSTSRITMIMIRIQLIILPLITLIAWLYGYSLYSHSRHVLDASSTSHPHPHLPLTTTQLSNKPSPNYTSPSNLFHFSHITDLHISKFNAQKYNGLTHLRSYLTNVLPKISPSFVVVTGDLTDAKDKFKVGSKQYEDEWQRYQDTLAEFNLSSPFWLDLRGNHDCFNVPGWDSRVNYFAQYSSTKRENFVHHVETPFGKYAFIGIDTCPRYGPSRPFNFFALFDSSDVDYVNQHANSSNIHNVILSHYPIATTVYSSHGLNPHISLWLCGHLHKLIGAEKGDEFKWGNWRDMIMITLGLGNTQMHIYHPHLDILELELGDSKVNAMYRIMAMDHEFMSFRDLAQDFISSPDTPIIMITWPKDTRYLIPKVEDGSKLKDSPYIRFLVWPDSISTDSNIEIITTIDGQRLESTPIFVGQESGSAPLYIQPWNASKYNDGRDHKLRIHVRRIGATTNVNATSSSHKVVFRLDGQRSVPLDGGFGEKLLGIHFESLIKDLLFYNVFLVTFIYLLIPKLFILYKEMRGEYRSWRASISQRLVRLDENPTRIDDAKWFIQATFFRFTCLASRNTYWYPSFLYCLYVVVGPFFFGGLIPSLRQLNTDGTFNWEFWDKGWAAMYMYGVYIFDINEWIPLLDCAVFALFEMAYSCGLFIIYLSFCLTPTSLIYAEDNPRRIFPIHRSMFVRLLVVCCVFYQISTVFVIGVFYGYESVVFSPGKTLRTGWAVWTLWKVLLLRRHDLDVVVVGSSTHNFTGETEGHPHVARETKARKVKR